MNIDTSGMEAALERVGSTLIIWGPRIAAAIAILVITHFVAKLVEKAIGRLGTKVAGEDRESRKFGNEQIWAQAGRLGYWVLWLFGFLIALQPLQLGEVVAPLNSLLNEIGLFLPNLIGATAIFIVGLALSKIAKGITENAVGMVNIDRFLKGETAEDDAAPASTDTSTTGQSVASAAGTAVQLLVLLPIALAAIDVLGITAVTVPVRELLATILVAVPHVIAAGLVLVVAFLIGRWIASAAQNFLEGLGANKAGESIGLSGERFTLSRISYHVVLIAVMLFAFVEAARLLNFDMVSQIADETVRLGGQIIFGAALIALGFVVARAVSKVLSDSGDAKLASVARYAIVALAIAMGLSFMGIATEIVIIAFGAILGAIAIAAAIAFGIGGRQTAHEMLQEWKDQNGPS